MAIEIRNVLLEVVGDTRHARSELERLERKLGGLDNETEISVRAETNRANRRLGELEKRLKGIDRSRVSPQVSVEIGQALAQLGEMRSRLTTLANKRTKVDVEFDRNALREVLDFERGLLRMAQGLERASRPARTFGDTVGNLVQATKSVTPVINGLAIVIGIKLVSGLLAVGASAAAAIGGVVALGSALLASLGPAVALAVAVVSRIAAVFDVLKQQENAAKAAKQQALSGSQQNVAAARQEEAAARAIEDAHEQVGLAAERVSQATVEAYEAMEQAAEDVEDAILRVGQAEIGLDQARLDIKKAEQALKEFVDQAGLSLDQFKKFTDVSFDFDAGDLKGIFEGESPADRLDLEQLIIDVRRAKEGEKQATDDLEDSETNLQKARQRNAEFLRDGIRAHQPYIDALRAQDNAQESLSRSIEDAKAGQDALSAAQAGAIVAADDLSAAEKRLLVVLRRLKDELRAVFGPATDAVIGALARALGNADALFGPLQFAIAALGRAWGHLIDTLAAEFVKPRWIAAFIGFFDLAQQLTRVLGEGVFVNFLRIIRNIALVAGPMLVQVFEDLNRWLGRLAQKTNDLDGIRPLITIMVDGFRVWSSLVGALIDLFVALIEAAGPIGNEFVGWIRDSIKSFTKWLKTAEGQEEVKEFFEDTLPAVKSLLGFLFRLVKIGLRVFQILSPVIKGFFDGLNFVGDVLLFILGLLQDFVHLPFVTWVLELVGQFLAFGTVLKLVRAVFIAIRSLGGIVEILKAVGGRLIKPFVDAFNGILRLVAKFAPGLAARLQAAVIGAAKKVGEKLTALAELGKKIVAKIFDGIKAVANFGRDVAVFWVRTIRAGLEAIIGRVLAAGRWIVGKFVEGITAVAHRIETVGRALLDGLLNGFTTIGKKAFDAIKGLVKKIVDAVKDFLGIHSPSKVFFNIGQDMLAGLIGGFSSGDVVGFIKDQLGGLSGLALDLAKAGLLDLPSELLGKLGGAGVDLFKDLVPGLAKGGIVTDRIFAQLGEKGKEAVLPLTGKVLSQLGAAIAGSMRFPAATPGPSAVALAGAGAGLNTRPGAGAGTVIKQMDLTLPGLPGTSYDPVYAAEKLFQELGRRGKR